MMKTSGIEAVDLFAGTGWGVACQRLGIPEHGVENMPEAVASRSAAGMHTWMLDVWDVLEKADPGSPEFASALLIASPPCQTFSMAGKGVGRAALDEVIGLIRSGTFADPVALRSFGEQHDPRTALVLTPLAYVAAHRPTYVVLEQVPTVLPVWQECAEVLRQWGYSVVTGNLQAEMYGVPQTRKRAILIARRDGIEAAMPVPTHSRYYPRDPKRLDAGVLPWVSMAEAMLAIYEKGWGLTSRPSPTITGGGTETGGAEPIAKLSRYALTDGWTADRPSITVVGSFQPDIIAAPGYRTVGGYSRQNAPGSVRVSVSEAGVLQSYPADFPFQGAKGKQHLQVGNAVPPLLAEAILRSLFE